MDIQKLRKETRYCQNVLHFNNAGSSLVPDCVFQAQVDYLTWESRIGGYEAFNRFNDKIEQIYSSLGKLLNCDKSEIALLENATRAWDLIFYSLDLKKGDEVITGHSEYASNFIAFLQLKKKVNIKIVVIENNEFGEICLTKLQQRINEKTKLIAITHMPTNGGLVNPAEEVGVIAKKNDILYLLDACQSTGQYPLDVQKIQCDFLSATGRKYLRGPRGTGFLYVKSSVEIEPVFLDLHSALWTHRDEYKVRDDARKFECWEKNFAALVGLGRAVDYALEIDIEDIWVRNQYLAKLLRSSLQKEGLQVHDIGQVQSGIVTFTSESIKSVELSEKLKKANINTSVSYLDYARLDLEDRKLPNLLRASLHYYNTESEIEKFCEVLSNMMN